MTEHQNLEWKESWRDEYLRWICGFANAQGGKLVIGRNNKGEAVGVAKARKLLEDLPNKIRDVLGIVADVRLVKDAGKDLIEIEVEPHPSPISYKGEYHYRSGATKQELKGAALDRFLLKKHGLTWDGIATPKVSARQLSKDAIAAFRKLARQSKRLDASVLKEPTASLLEKLNLIEGDELKRAAVLLFHPDPERYITGAFIKVGFFQTESELVYQDDLHGDLFTQLRQTIEILHFKYLKAAISYQGIQRIETYPVPYEALREALLNAIIHRDYGVPAPIQIRVYQDKLRIWNPGELPDRWSVEKLMGEHSSKPFNPNIANAFFRSGDIEAWGRGIQRIFDACREAEMPAPQFSYEPGDLWVEFAYSPAYLAIIPATQAEARLDKRLDKELDKKLGANRAAIVRLISEDPRITVRQIASRLRMSRTGIDKNIQVLKAEGYLRRIGPLKGGHWEVLK